MSNLQDFVRLVARMRRMQKATAVTASRGALAETERLEQSVDRMLEQMGFGKMKAQQLRLMEEPQKVD